MLGVIVNPIAGMGGVAALHGTDGDAVRSAVEMGAIPVASGRAARALREIHDDLPSLEVLAAPGAMGFEICDEIGFDTVATSGPVGARTSARDTEAAAAEMIRRGVELLMFVGGDGTARDVAGVVGLDVPLIGVPSGVKMHSGVFGTTPEAAADIAVSLLRNPRGTRLVEVEILDVEDPPGGDAGSGLRSFATARVPFLPTKLQGPKAGSRRGTAAVEALCHQIADAMQPDTTYVIGPGTTTSMITSKLGLEGSVVGVDVVRDGRLIIEDATEAELVEHVSDGSAVRLILGVIGGQGFLLGRGNQQISGRVLDAIDREDIVVIASAEKIEALDPPVLHVDIDHEGAVEKLAGFHRVMTGPRTSTMMRVLA